MKKIHPTVIWNKNAAEVFKKAIAHIRNESPSNAEKVKDEITTIIDSLPSHPKKYPPDKFKLNNTGIFRAFECNSYRIADKHSTDEIRILRIRHVKQEPKEH